ncbi:MAG: hypothetical protein PHN75_18035, partial [Syntrophales bacterium]|nr:hypothetical protein [Syntrophales bacterium]
SFYFNMYFSILTDSYIMSTLNYPSLSPPQQRNLFIIVDQKGLIICVLLNLAIDVPMTVT